MSASGGSSLLLKNLILSRPEHERAIKAFCAVLDRVESALQRRSEDAVAKSPPRVVALVPSYFPPSMIVDCYNAGLRHFGESLHHELIKRAENEDILRHCPDIKWHFYGPIQPSLGNSRLVRTANLFIIETVQNETVANILERCAAQEKLPGLKVMAQVSCGAAVEREGDRATPLTAHVLCRHVVEDCPHLELCGLMLDGSANRSANRSSNNEADDDDFQMLTKARLDVCRRLQIEVEDFELSMGMNHDFELAVEMGSSNVRIGGPQLFGSPSVLSGTKDRSD